MRCGCSSGLPRRPPGRLLPTCRKESAASSTQLATLFDGLLQRLDQLTAEVEVQRRERLEDVELLTELATSGWRNVDRRLGRLEKMVERQQAPASNSSPVARFPDRQPAAVKE